MTAGANASQWIASAADVVADGLGESATNLSNDGRTVEDDVASLLEKRGLVAVLEALESAAREAYDHVGENGTDEATRTAIDRIAGYLTLAREAAQS